MSHSMLNIMSFAGGPYLSFKASVAFEILSAINITVDFETPVNKVYRRLSSNCANA